MTLFRVYFHVLPYTPAPTYRYLWANDLEHAQVQVATLTETHEGLFKRMGFNLIAIEEDKLNFTFTEWIEVQRKQNS